MNQPSLSHESLDESLGMPGRFFKTKNTKK